MLAHINKTSAIGGRDSNSESYSGSTAWHNSVRSRLSLAPIKDEDALLVEHMKANLGAKATPVRLEWREGSPLVAGGYSEEGPVADAIKAAEKTRDATDKEALVALIQDFDKRGEPVTTASQGPATVFHLLKGEALFPKSTKKDRLMRLLREMETAGAIFRRTIRTAQRKDKEVFTCSEISAPIQAIEPPGEASRGVDHVA